MALEQLGAFGVGPKPNGENVTEDGAQHRAGEKCRRGGGLGEVTIRVFQSLIYTLAARLGVERAAAGTVFALFWQQAALL